MNLFKRITAMLTAMAAVLTLGVVQANAGPGVGTYYANSPQGGLSGPALRKFVDSLPGLGPTNANNLGQYLPIAMPIDNPAFPDDDYYEIGIVEYTEKMHTDLPKATKLRGYKDLNPAADPKAHYLGPVIVAQRNRPVRIKYTNMLPTGNAGKLFVPVDKTVMGAGTGPLGGAEEYTQNRASIHLHGGLTPWISDGTPHQWITPAGEATSYATGVSQQNVPDMPNPGAGSGTLYYTNAQSARLMFYHDHAYGITGLNVYAGMAAGYLIVDPVEQGLVNAGFIPSAQVPLVIQDKTFVPNDIAIQDSKWDTALWGKPGDLWFPHVYETNQDPTTIDGTNPMGRWDYGPWFWPIFPAPNPLPEVSHVPEAFMDTPVINGTAYPYLNVDRKAYRFRILNAANDRFWNLSLFYADPADPNGTEVKMVPAVPHPGDPTWPAAWPVDGREGGVPEPTLAGPDMIVIGNEGGLLPAPAVIPAQPVNYEYFRRSATVLNILEHALYMGPAERADVIIDFSQVPAGSKIILYNDCPAPVPAFDTRYDYYTGNPDQTAIGGTPPTVAGFGPNTRTIMQFRVSSAPASAAFNLAALEAALPVAYGNSQDPPIVPQSAYGPAFGATYADKYATIFDGSLNFPTFSYTDTSGKPVSYTVMNKAIIEEFDMEYGRMMSFLGSEEPFTNALNQTSIPYLYTDPPLEFLTAGGTQLWKVTHNGVDTHAIHFHLFDVQLINRIGWDGTIKPPDGDELGWKETVKMNPLEDIMVALRPKAPPVPFAVPNSIRPLAPTMPIGAVLPQAVNVPGDVINAMFDFGWEYVWHCHLLGHEEYDMMRPTAFSVPTAVPAAVVDLGAVASSMDITLAWTDNATNETGYRVERQVNAGAYSTLVILSPDAAGYVDAAVAPGRTYNYRVFAFNLIGDSAASNIASAGPIANVAPVNVSASAVNGLTGVPQQIVVRWSDANGPDDLKTVYLQIGNNPTGGYTKIKYAPWSNTLYMTNDAGTAWIGGFTAGSANTISNSRITLNCATTAVTKSGNVLTLSVTVTPLAGFTGSKPLFLYALDRANAASAAWSLHGYWKIAAMVNVPPVNVSAAAANGNTNVAQTASGVWSDANGAGDINHVYLQIGTNATGGPVKLRYTQSTNLLWLLNDTGTAWLGGVAPGTAGTISNSRVTLNFGATTVSSVGNDLTVNFNITPLAGWTGAKALLLYAIDSKGATTPIWSYAGTVTINP